MPLSEGGVPFSEKEIAVKKENGDNIRVSGFYNISDKSQYSYKIQLTLDREENLIVDSSYSEREEESELGLQSKQFQVKLMRVDRSRNSGFVQYWFDESEVPPDQLKRFKDIILVRDVYHRAKDFYHQHEADGERDAARLGIITPYKGDIDADDNDFLIQFLTSFAPVLESYARIISDWNFLAIDIEEVAKEKKKNWGPIIEVASRINRLCENASIEYTYCKTLLSSIHNKSFAHNLVIGEDEPDDLKRKKKEWRRSALNIRNSMRFIENIKYKNQNRLSGLSRELVERIKETTDILSSVSAEIQGNTTEIKATTTAVNEVSKEIAKNTEDIKAALAQGKRAEGMSFILACLSICISSVFGLWSASEDVFGRQLNGLWFTLLMVVLLGFGAWLLYQRFSKRYAEKLMMSK